MGKRKRITMKLKTPNPLFVKWLTEWRDKARKENSKMEFCFSMALQSLKRYPLPLEKGKDCKILKGFGDKLCLMIDNKLKEHQMNGGHSLDDTFIGNQATVDGLIEPIKKKRKSKSGSDDSSPSRGKTRQSKEYLPQTGSGAYAILITLYAQGLDPNYPGFLTKQEIIREGQHLSHTSFTKPDPGTRYTAWSSMKTLISKNLVVKKSSPAKFSLSDEGLDLATKLFDKWKNPSSSQENVMENVQNEVVCIDSSDDEGIESSLKTSDGQVSSNTNSMKSNSCSTSSGQSSAMSLQTGDFFNFRGFSDKYVCDTVKNYSSTTSVTSSKSSVISESKMPLKPSNNKGKSKTIKKHASSTSIASSTQSSSQEECFIFPPNSFDIILYVDTCETSGSKAQIQDDPILAELTQLQINYEVKKLKIGDYVWICRDRTSEKELVLPYIIERKRMDDFGQSIKDGRYHEQKFRLKKCGIQNVTYLIEKFGNNERVGIPLTTLYQAATNTAIQDGFCVKFTENIRDTGRYLANFSNILVKMFQSKTLVSCPKENLSEISLEDDLISIMTFKEFNSTSSKNKPMKVSDLFVKMLIQIKGMSVDRALGITEKYPTPALLKRAYDENPGIKGEKLLASIQFGDCNKCIGPVLSKIVHQLFTLESFN